MSALFIRRPVATILLAIGLALAGLFAYLLLPVAALPQVDYPTISVSANLAGASPDTMATAVTTPLIKQFQTIAGIDTITAQSQLGSTQIVLQFALDRNIDAAAADVQAAIAAVSRRLPPTMTSPPTYRKANPADAPILLLTVNSATLPLTDVDNLAENVIAPTISTIDGVAEAQVMGAQTYAVRVDADPAQLAARGLDVASLSSTLANANSHTPLGTVGNNAQTITVDTNTQLMDAAGFRSLIVSDTNGAPVRLGDVARVYDSVQNLKTASWYDGGRAIVLAVMRQPGANTVAVVDAIKAQLPALRASLPEAVSIDVMNDASTSIRNAVHDVGITLALVIGLVMLVIYLFLGRLLPTFIPGLAVPLSLLSACGGMYLLGFSIDNISLLGLTLSVGLVVDDAIVMLENIIRRVEAGEAPMAAALAGSREVGWTIVSMSVSLIAVFIPLLLMGGVIGRLFNEFGLVVAMAIAASALVSLTLTPMMAARLPPSPHTRRPPGIGARAYEAVLAAYDRGVVWCLRHRVTVFVVFLGTVVASAWLLETLPTTFFPQEDTGQLIVSTQARNDISFDAMSALQQQVMAAVRASPDVAHVASSVGGGFGGGANSGTLFVQLKPAGERPDLPTVLADLRRALAPVAGVRTFVTPTQSLRIGGRSSRAQYQLVVEALTDADARTWAGKFADAMTARPTVFADVNTDTDNAAPAVLIDVDQDHAAALGVNSASIRQALSAGFGGITPATIETGSGSFDVILEYDQALQWNDAMLASIQVKAANGSLVPLSAIAKVVRSSGPVTVNQTGELRSVTISFNLPDGVALGTATGAVNAIRASLGVPASVVVAFGGTAQVFAQSAATEGLLIAAAIVTIYLVLGILYESFIHPLTILSGLPAAAFGALLALKVGGFDLSVIAMIGILMLIGIVKKNAIMMVDVALQLQRAQNVSATWAIREACQRRFRPIMMTTFCAILGVLPIALGTGASSELRQPLGVAVVGGLVTSQLLTLFITPVIYTALDEIPARFRALVTALGDIASGRWGDRAARSTSQVAVRTAGSGPSDQPEADFPTIPMR